jgi:hypothetical protein
MDPLTVARRRPALNDRDGGIFRSGEIDEVG